MTIKNVFVVGAGLMGGGIAQVCAQAGLQVGIMDVDPAILEKSIENIAWSVGKLVEKGKLTEKKQEILDRIEICKDFTEAARSDMAIEAVFEQLDVKKEVFKELDTCCPPQALIASNTSAIPITELAAVTGRPQQVLGLHFFNPVPLMRAVEVVKALQTSEETMQVAEAFVKALGKSPVRVESDVAGFLLNRINLVSYVEAIRLLEQGIGTVADIDRGVRLAFGRPMGPFETGDMVGLDVSYGALSAIYEESRDIRFYPPRLLQRKVKAEQLGKKTGRGWYTYDQEGKKI
jgi:3-hydroxybutyryl-CoA dehydrogenase